MFIDFRGQCLLVAYPLPPPRLRVLAGTSMSIFSLSSSTVVPSGLLPHNVRRLSGAILMLACCFLHFFFVLLIHCGPFWSFVSQCSSTFGVNTCLLRICFLHSFFVLLIHCGPFWSFMGTCTLMFSGLSFQNHKTITFRPTRAVVITSSSVMASPCRWRMKHCDASNKFGNRIAF